MISSLGIVVRVLVVLSWITVVGLHANAQRLAARGDVTSARDARTLDADAVEQVDAEVLVQRRWSAHGLSQGTLTTVGLSLEDISFIPGLASALPLLGAHLEAPLAGLANTPPASSAPAPPVHRHAGHAPRATPAVLTLTWEENTTAQGEVRALSATARFAGLNAVALATFTPREVSVSYSAPGYDGTRSFPPLAGVHAVAVIAILPAGLRANRRFTVPMIGLDANLTPRVVSTRFLCTAEEESVTNLGVRLLMRVEQSNEAGHLESTLWCDDSGLVYRQRWQDPVVQIELEGLNPASTPAASVPATSIQATH